MFLHRGLHSQLEAGGWVVMNQVIRPKDDSKLQKSFTAADFDARARAQLAGEAGRRT